MTIEQALKIKQNWTAEQARNDLERLLLRDERPANKVIALACKALEKQIPKNIYLLMEDVYVLIVKKINDHQIFTVIIVDRLYIGAMKNDLLNYNIFNILSEDVDK